jgi:hypothetical protein
MVIYTGFTVIFHSYVRLPEGKSLEVLAQATILGLYSRLGPAGTTWYMCRAKSNKPWSEETIKSDLNDFQTIPRMFQNGGNICTKTLTGWWVQPTPLKNGVHPVGIMTFPNHQPDHLGCTNHGETGRHFPTHQSIGFFKSPPWREPTEGTHGESGTVAPERQIASFVDQISPCWFVADIIW